MADTEEYPYKQNSFFSDPKTIIPLIVIIFVLLAGFLLTKNSQNTSGLPNYSNSPLAPSDVRIGNIATSSADIKWVNHADNATFIQLGYLPETQQKSDWTTIKIRPDLELLELTDIQPNVKYNVKVQACNVVGCSDWAQNSFTTLPPGTKGKVVQQKTFHIQRK